MYKDCDLSSAQRMCNPTAYSSMCDRSSRTAGVAPEQARQHTKTLKRKSESRDAFLLAKQVEQNSIQSATSSV